MTAVVSASLVGAEKAIANFGELKRAVQNRVLRKAVRAGSAPCVRAAKRGGTFNDVTGVLRKSATVKIQTFSSGITSAIIGPKNKVSSAVDLGSHNFKKKNRSVSRNPALYAHLVELGHRIAIGQSGRSQKNFVLKRRGVDWVKAGKSTGSSGGFVAPRPFMLNAFNASKSQQLSALTSKFEAEVIAEAAKLNSNG